MRIPILRGRNFSAQEARDGVNFDGISAIVSEGTARKFWPGEDRVGQNDSSLVPNGPVRKGDRLTRSFSGVVVGVAGTCAA